MKALTSSTQRETKITEKTELEKVAKQSWSLLQSGTHFATFLFRLCSGYRCLCWKKDMEVASLCETARSVSLCSPDILLGRIKPCLFHSVCVFQVGNRVKRRGCQQNGRVTWSCSHLRMEGQCGERSSSHQTKCLFLPSRGAKLEATGRQYKLQECEGKNLYSSSCKSKIYSTKVEASQVEEGRTCEDTSAGFITPHKI